MWPMFYSFFWWQTIILKILNGELHPHLSVSDALALIFSGTVTTWDDPAIMATTQSAPTARGGVATLNIHMSVIWRLLSHMGGESLRKPFYYFHFTNFQCSFP